MSLLNSEEQSAIADAIGRAELRTAGELVVATVPKSDSYEKERFIAALFWTFGMAVFANWLLPDLSTLYLVLLQVPLLLVSYGLAGLPFILRPMAGGRCDAMARQRAMRMFAERGVHQTRDRSGLLIMLSELEHQVVILGDAGIHEKVGDPGWQGYVERIVTGLKAGKAGEAVVGVLDDLGEILATHFPARGDDTNELGNEVVVES